MNEEVLSVFREEFGDHPPPRRFRAPGRVNLIGAHVDYNLGPVMPIPLDRGTDVAIRPRADRRVRLVSRNREGRVETALEAAAPADVPDWCRYPLGVVAVLLERGLPIRGFDLAVAGDLDIGAGLSSSASLLVAVARALDGAFGLALAAEDVAAVAFEAETRHVGVACGIMDPMAAAVARPGCALFLDCRDRSYRHVPLDRDRLGIVIVDSTTRRALARSLFNQRVAECRQAVAVLSRHRPDLTSLRDATRDDLETHREELGDTVGRRARHVVEEIERVFAFRAALAADDLVTCGRLVSASHRSLRELYEASTEELDHLVAAACAEPGVLGARLTGAGWGGCVLVLTEKKAAERLAARVGPGYRERFGRDARFHVVGVG